MMGAPTPSGWLRACRLPIAWHLLLVCSVLPLGMAPGFAASMADAGTPRTGQPRVGLPALGGDLARIQSDAALFLWADRALELGYDEPHAVIGMLRPATARSAPPGVDPRLWRRTLWRVLGSVGARGGDATAAQHAVAALQGELVASAASGGAESALPPPSDLPLWRADAALVLAWQADQARSSRGRDHAQEALAQYELACGGLQREAGCDDAVRWQALTLLARRLASRGEMGRALGLLDKAQTLAAQMQDVDKQVATHADRAYALWKPDDSQAAHRELQAAQALASGSHVALTQLRALLLQVRLARNDPTLAPAQRLQMAERGLPLAKAHGSVRWQARVQMEMADAALAQGDAERAIDWLTEAMAVHERFADVAALDQARFRRGMARLGAGDLARGRADANAALASWRARDQLSVAQAGLVNYAEQLHRAGESRAAVEALHAERELFEGMAQSERATASVRLRQLLGMQTQAQELERLKRINALQRTQLEARQMQQRIWGLTAVLGALLLATFYVLLRRSKASVDVLQREHALMHEASQRDALTGLPNRRSLQSQMENQTAQGQFEGGLIALDVDHFKAINDEHGHLVGDEVLLALSRRFEQAVRGGDCVGRWGGEEFLVVVAAQPPQPLGAMVERLLAQLTAEPIAVSATQSLAVTLSAGWLRLPLDGQTMPLSAEQALGLADAALYLAKAKGRNRAVGIVHAKLQQLEDLASMLRSLRQAEQDGRATLSVHQRGS